MTIHYLNRYLKMNIDFQGTLSLLINFNCNYNYMDPTFGLLKKI